MASDGVVPRRRFQYRHPGDLGRVDFGEQTEGESLDIDYGKGVFENCEVK